MFNENLVDVQVNRNSKMKKRNIFLVLATSAITLLVFIVISCKKDGCMDASSLDDCKKKCKGGLKYEVTFNPATKECCCNP